MLHGVMSVCIWFSVMWASEKQLPTMLCKQKGNDQELMQSHSTSHLQYQKESRSHTKFDNFALYPSCFVLSCITK